MKDKYVFDSSVWISMERDDPSVLKMTRPMIEKNQVCLVDVIEAEVLRGAATKRDYDKLADAFSAFTKLSTSWTAVAAVAFKIAQKGFMPPLIDIYIATAVMEHQKILVSHDKHFLHIQKVVPLQLMFL